MYYVFMYGKLRRPHHCHCTYQLLAFIKLAFNDNNFNNEEIYNFIGTNRNTINLK